MNYFMNPNKTEEQFLKIPRERWRYEVESGKITWEEYDVRSWLWLKANPVTGKVVVNYIILAEEMKERFPYIKDIVNKITKIMLSLKTKQRLWFLEHSGSRNAVEVELADFPLISRGYIDISHRFQQSFGRGDGKEIPQNTGIPAELPSDEQRLGELKDSLNELKGGMSINSPSRAPKIDRKIIDRKIDSNNSSKTTDDSDGSKAYKKRFKEEHPWSNRN